MNWMIPKNACMNLLTNSGETMRVNIYRKNAEAIQQSGAECAQETAQKTAQKISDSIMKTFKAIQDDPSITIAKIKVVTGLSERTIKTHQAFLKENGFIQRIAPDKGGYWLICKT